MVLEIQLCVVNELAQWVEALDLKLDNLSVEGDKRQSQVTLSLSQMNSGMCALYVSFCYKISTVFKDKKSTIICGNV